MARSVVRFSPLERPKEPSVQPADLGKSSDRLQHGDAVAVVNDNEERVVLRGAIPGEVTVNVYAYRKAADGPVPVRVALYRLRGDDRTLLRRTVRLRYQGEELTAFRFTLDPSAPSPR
jgi:hypothetical protein